jgi:nitrogen regulatory protein P-II 1
MVKMIVAIVRSTDLKKVETALLAAGVRGLTVSKVKGIGEEKAFLEQNLVAHVKFEIIVPEEDADRVTQVIVNAAWTGCAGDGIVAVLPVETFIKIRETKTGHFQV